MHIAIFSDSYRPYRSGVVRSIETFARELRKKGHKVYIFAPSYGQKEKEEDVFRFPSFRAPNFKEFAVAIPWAPGLKDTLKRLEVELVHVHSPFLLGQLGARAALKLGLPLVCTYHTLYEQYIHYFPLAPAWASSWVRRYTIWFCNHCHLVIAPSPEIASFLQNSGIRTRVEVLPTGVDISSYERADPTWLRSYTGLGEKDIILLYVGRLGKEKNLEFLLRSFALIRASLSQSHLVLVGSGPWEKRLRAEVEKLGIEEAVHFLGAFPFEEMPNIYRGADLFVFSSMTETQGLVIAEAKAAGLPVVAVSAYGVKAMVQDGVDGFLVPPDEKLFAKAVKDIISNEEIRQIMSVRARENVRQFSSASMAQRLATFYEELIAGNKKRV
ncbi:MAG: glycosyltransferase family 4 protein [Thermanaeromonas sp.]|uniref:glycosyltransferase family 4 protein n=1 Tax=Thermanaeromonas sp. TaxID=2003697 RepID=UPI002439169B|nr:glycosyltransferase family 4 protein [Thermanaeromonas sp.]MCG0278629.1 glycosyltransferase family 4 protein [Thermanaeromonas sp.]